MKQQNTAGSGSEASELVSQLGPTVDITSMEGKQRNVPIHGKEYLSVLDSEKCNENGMPLNVKLSMTNLIGDAVRQMLLETRDSWESYCIRVVQDYRERIPASQQDIEFSNSGDTLRDAMNWRKAITRYLEVDGHNRCPADIIESMIAALSQPYQSNCRRAVANRQGYVGVPLLDGDESAACYGQFLKEAGEAIAAVSVIFHDHQITEQDKVHIPKAITEIQEARAQLANMQRRLELALDPKGRATGGPINSREYPGEF